MLIADAQQAQGVVWASAMLGTFLDDSDVLEGSGGVGIGKLGTDPGPTDGSWIIESASSDWCESRWNNIPKAPSLEPSAHAYVDC